MYYRKDGIKITGRFYEDENGTKYPNPQWFNGATDEQLAALGVTKHSDPVKPNYDPDTQAEPVQGADGEYGPPADLPLEEAKARKKAAIDALKQEKQLEGFTYDGMTFQCDEVAIARINATWNFAQVDSNYTQPFILKDNTTVTLTNAQCVGLGYACGQFVSGLTFTARQLKDAVLAATTVAEVRAVTWPE